MGNIIKKLVVGVVVGGILFGATNALGFPFVFQALFFGYAMLGAAVFMILDFPTLKPFGGVKAVGALLVFYAILSVVYIAGASMWPQYDPEDEKPPGPPVRSPPPSPAPRLPAQQRDRRSARRPASGYATPAAPNGAGSCGRAAGRRSTDHRPRPGASLRLRRRVRSG